MKFFGVTALGELLIDFTENGISEQGNPIMEANPGGAPCNVLSMLSKLGHRTAFIGKIGKDMFGAQLKKAVSECGIDVSGLVEDETVNTTLAFVHTLPGGDREFSFYRNPGADMMLGVNDLKKDLLENCEIFHYGSLSMTHENCRLATEKAISAAKKSGALLSFDPNLREPLWSSLSYAKECISYGFAHCDILKISDNEIEWFTGESDYDAGVEKLRKTYDIPLILVSLGKCGSLAYSGDVHVHVPTFGDVKTIETTGAGDTFGACVLHYVLDHGLRDFTEDELKEMLLFANAAASIVTTRKGALRVMPEKDEITALLKSCL